MKNFLLKKWVRNFVIFFFFITIFLLSSGKIWDFDIWFHLKSGEVISEQGLIRHDVFSFTATDREWSPYEWLFQITVYHFQTLFGFEALKFLVGFVSTLLTLVVYLIFNKVFRLNYLISLLITFLFFASTIEFMSPRPHLLAYFFLCINLFLVLLYFKHKKNLLALSIPITLAWANMHGSVFLDVYFFLGFSVVALISYFVQKKKNADEFWLEKFKVLGIYSVITAVLTVLPPLYTLQYELLWRFYKERDLITRYISEWAPLSTSPISSAIYILITFIVLVIFVISVYKAKDLTKYWWALPLLPLIATPFLASRNSFLGYLVLSIILAGSLEKFKILAFSSFKKWSVVLGVVIVLVFHLWMLSDKKREQTLDTVFYPVKAASFIKDYKLAGNMFNEYGFGGYLLYHLYPEQKVYIDGRTDLYLCCEMPDTLELSYQKNNSDLEYQKYLDSLWQKNQISFVLLRTEKHVVSRKIARILQNDPNWSLIFWDDVSHIYIRKDGKNDSILAEFAAIAATPYAKDPVKEGQLDQALAEYQKMISVADSSKSRNAIGYILLKKGQFEKAKIEFEKAVVLNTRNESPYMNLAELAVRDKNPGQAIELYKQAKVLAPDRGLIYIRLGQLILGTSGDLEAARNIWLEGLKNTVDQETRDKIQQLLNVNQ